MVRERFVWSGDREMQRCNTEVCRDCKCAVHRVGRTVSTVAANANFASPSKPKHVVRRDPVRAAESFKKRFKGSLEILA
jgi:hypothetical protein